MNRAQRRKMGLETKVPTFTMTETELLKYNEKSKRKAVKETFIYHIFSGVMWLRDQGWGRKRLNEYVRGCLDIADSVSKDYLDYVDMITTIKEETGIDINDYIE